MLISLLFLASAQVVGALTQDGANQGLVKQREITPWNSQVHAFNHYTVVSSVG